MLIVQKVTEFYKKNYLVLPIAIWQFVSESHGKGVKVNVSYCHFQQIFSFIVTTGLNTGRKP